AGQAAVSHRQGPVDRTPFLVRGPGDQTIVTLRPASAGPVELVGPAKNLRGSQPGFRCPRADREFRSGHSRARGSGVSRQCSLAESVRQFSYPAPRQAHHVTGGIGRRLAPTVGTTVMVPGSRHRTVYPANGQPPNNAGLTRPSLSGTARRKLSFTSRVGSTPSACSRPAARSCGVTGSSAG